MITAMKRIVHEEQSQRGIPDPGQEVIVSIMIVIMADKRWTVV
jgi:hypothetical protein